MAKTAADSVDAGKAWPLFRSLNGYRIQFLSHDLFAGLTLAAIAIPEQMATARLGGFTPQIGFSPFWRGRWHSRHSEATASCPAARIRPSPRSSPAVLPCSPHPARRIT